MFRILKFGIMLLLVRAPLAASPQGLEFKARLLKNPPIYHLGEPIEIELSYSTRTVKRYYGSFTGPSPYIARVTPRVTPHSGVIDLVPLQEMRGLGSILSGSGYVTSQPLTQRLELGEWYRFLRPGDYSVIVVSTEVSRVKDPEEGGGLEHLTLASNPLKFEVLPSDPAWNAERLRHLARQLKVAKNDGDRAAALQQLAVLDTPAAARLLVKYYLADDNGGQGWILDGALHTSSHTELIILLLARALSDPAANIPQGLPRLLADLQTRQQLGVMPPHPSAPAERETWAAQWKARSKVRSRYLAQANTLFQASIERRSGPNRARAIYQVWYDATQLERTGVLTPDAVSRLQSNVLAVAGKLDHARQVQFALLAWQSLPHEKLHALVRSLAQDSIRHAEEYGGLEGFELWHEGWPAECDAAILQAIQRSGGRINKNIVLMLDEAEHPELDQMLETELREPPTFAGAFQSQRMAAVVLRAGSRNLVPVVDSYLDQMAATGLYDCDTQAELFGYLFRVAPDDAKVRLSAELQAKNSYCGAPVLRALHQLQRRPSEEIIPVATTALNSPNLVSAQVAATYLGAYGPASSEEALWHRLEELWRRWREKSSELQNQSIGAAATTANQTAMLEQALASALAHAKKWKLSASEKKRLSSGCITRGCSDAAKGKLFVGL